MRASLLALLVCFTFGTFAFSQDFDFSESSAIDEATLRGHIRFLADDSLEGRGPGSRGDEVTQVYLSTQFEMLGLAPGAADGSWKQSVPLVGVTTQSPATVEFVSGSETVTLKTVEDLMTTIGQPIEKVSIEDAELVFVGYGITAPQYQWDDYKGVDLKGKILVMMNNDPADDPQLFEGKRRLYYGRWDYKYESAARQGAAGAIIIHTTPSAGYPWQVVQTSWSGEEFELRGIETPRMKMKAWATEGSVKKLCEAGGQNLDTLRAFAEQRDFRPVPLGVRMSLDLTAKVREQDTANVYGVLEGSDPKLRDEYVVFMAHHDHLGIGPRDDKGDAIYNGAVDNAAGVACLLAIAKAYSEADSAPRRSVLFAAVAAEEQGLLGSKYMAAHPPVPAGRMAALINMDGTNTLGRTRDVNVIGHGKSNLDALVQRVATAQGRDVTPDHFPDRGYYYRSDQFSLAKIGVPAVYLHAGIVVRDRPEGWGKEQQNIWVEKVYHQPSDQYDPNWDMSGAVEDTRLLFHVGDIAANNDEMPQWNPGDEFEAARNAALTAVATPKADATSNADGKEAAKPTDASPDESTTEADATE
jgi:Zn-dependent M28 family amino/carboxypeptidase